MLFFERDSNGLLRVKGYRNGKYIDYVVSQADVGLATTPEPVIDDNILDEVQSDNASDCDVPYDHGLPIHEHGTPLPDLSDLCSTIYVL